MHKDTCFQLNGTGRGVTRHAEDNAFAVQKSAAVPEPANGHDATFSAAIPPVTPELTYAYDGTFEGWLCCVAESYESKEIPGRIRPTPNNGIINNIIAEESLFYSKKIVTLQKKAERVRNGIAARIGTGFLHLLERSFCTCRPGREEEMLLFTHKGFRYGMRIMNLRQDPVIRNIHKGLRDLGREIDKWYGFVRFSDMQGILVAVIGAKNNVLPFLAPHFTDRFHKEHFMIYDENHKMALVYRPGRCAIIPMERFSLANVCEEEQMYRRLWKNYYEAIEIKPRHNETCRRTLMPKRYWDYLTEMASETS